MNISTHTRPPDYFYPRVVRSKAGARLGAEREKICAALEAESLAVGSLAAGWQERDSPSERAMREVEFSHREALHARLRRIDDALERLIAGSYGHCSECGKPIGRKRLAADPVISLCLACQTATETAHPSRSL